MTKEKFNQICGEGLAEDYEDVKNIYYMGMTAYYTPEEFCHMWKDLPLKAAAAFINNSKEQTRLLQINKQLADDVNMYKLKLADIYMDECDWEKAIDLMGYKWYVLKKVENGDSLSKEEMNWLRTHLQ